jgi:hypothetical protein
MAGAVKALTRPRLLLAPKRRARLIASYLKAMEFRTPEE